MVKKQDINHAVVDMPCPYSQITLLTYACLRHRYECSKPWILGLHCYLVLKHNHDLLRRYILNVFINFIAGEVPN